MTRQVLAFIVSILVLLPDSARTAEPTSKKADRPQHNQVYVKIIMPAAPADRGKTRFVVESWIAEDLKKRGQSTFVAVTKWVPLNLSPLEPTDVWDGVLGKQSYCRVGADIERVNAPKIKVHFSGWSPGGAFLTIPLKDEPGSRKIAAVEEAKTDEGMPYVAIFIGPPLESPKASSKRKQ